MTPSGHSPAGGSHRLTDLHLHTTASDGALSPEQLVDAAAAAGLTRIAVTDHDTLAATDVVAERCRERGIESIPGIEITAVAGGRDVHVLAYFVDVESPSFLTFLEAQRAQRVSRVEAIARRLDALGMPIDAAPLMSRIRAGASVGRPHVARILIDAGFVADIAEAFDKWLGAGMPAFVPRDGASPADVIRVIHEAGGVASLAHPGRTCIDAAIPRLRDEGLDAVEVFHSDHTPADVDKYLKLAAAFDFLVTGGSDYHGDPKRGVSLGSVSLPEMHWERLTARART